MNLFVNELLYITGEKICTIFSNFDCGNKMCIFYNLFECKSSIKEFNCCGKFIVGFKQWKDF